MHLAQDRHSRSILSGDLHQKTRDLRLKRPEDDAYNEYLNDQHSHDK